MLLTHGSLFSGVGGFELGAKMAGLVTLWNCESEPHKRLTLYKHFPEAMQYTDIRMLNNPPYVDVISGGFPCQDVSIANVSNKKSWQNGKVKGIYGERSGLWSEMLRICREVRPCYLLIENSPMLLKRGFEKVLCNLTQIGYVCEWQCLQASQFGYNHKRERIYCIAYPCPKRCVYHSQIFRELHEILPKQAPRQSPLSIPVKRFDCRSDYADVRMDDGFSSLLDRTRIEDMGNAVIPEIAFYLFECIKLHHKYNRP